MNGTNQNKKTHSRAVLAFFICYLMTCLLTIGLMYTIMPFATKSNELTLGYVILFMGASPMCYWVLDHYWVYSFFRKF